MPRFSVLPPLPESEGGVVSKVGVAVVACVCMAVGGVGGALEAFGSLGCRA